MEGKVWFRLNYGGLKRQHLLDIYRNDRSLLDAKIQMGTPQKKGEEN